MALTKGLAVRILSPLNTDAKGALIAYEKDYSDWQKAVSDANKEVLAAEKALEDLLQGWLYWNYSIADLERHETRVAQARQNFKHISSQAVTTDSLDKEISRQTKYNEEQRYITFLSSSAEYANDTMTFEFDTELIGGLMGWSITLKNRPIEHLYINSECQFFIDGRHWFSGYIIELDSFENDSNTYIIKGSGYWRRLRDANVIDAKIPNLNSSGSLYDLALELGKKTNILFGLNGISLDALKGSALYIAINAPSMRTKWDDFKDLKYDEFFEAFIHFCNSLYSVRRLYVTIDRFRVIKIHVVGSGGITLSVKDIVDNFVLIEGYDYHKSKITFDSSKIINSIDVFYKSGDKERYSINYKDTISINRYGLKRAKILANNSSSLNTTHLLASDIVNQLKEPFARMTIDDAAIKGSQPFKHSYTYRCINSPRENSISLEPFWSTNKWFTSNSKFSLDKRTLDVHQSLRVSSSIFANDIFAKYQYDAPILNPKKIVGHFYVEDISASIVTISFYDSYGNDVVYQLTNTTKNVWHKFELDTKPTFCHDLMSVRKSAEAEPELFHIHSPTARDDDVIQIECLGKKGLFDIKKIRMVVYTSREGIVCLFSNFSAVVEHHKHYTLTLKKARYKIGHTRTCTLELGDKRETLVDAFKSEAKRIGAAIDFATK